MESRQLENSLVWCLLFHTARFSIKKVETKFLFSSCLPKSYLWSWKQHLRLLHGKKKHFCLSLSLFRKREQRKVGKISNKKKQRFLPSNFEKKNVDNEKFRK